MSSKLKDTVEAKEKGAYRQLLDADPTSGKLYVRWLADVFMNDGMKLENLPMAADSLRLFHRYRNNLQQRTIDEYGDLSALHKAVARFTHGTEGGMASAQDSKKDIIELLNRDGVRVVIPLSAEAATRHGKGTKWCTAYDEAANHFWNYCKDGPLFIVSVKEKEGTRRYQLNFEEGQYHDETEGKINLTALLTSKPSLMAAIRPYMERAVDRNGAVIANIPEELRTQTMHLSAIRQDAEWLNKVNALQRTEALCSEAVQQNGLTLQYVPERLRSQALCNKAIHQNGKALNFVPVKLRTEKMTAKAVENGASILHIPMQRRTKAMCEKAVKRNGFEIRYVPSALRTETMYLTAINQEPKVLTEIPAIFHTATMYKEALRRNGMGLAYVPEHKRDAGLSEIAVWQNGNALKYVPKKFLNEELYLAAVSTTGDALKLVSERLRDREICRAAVTQCGQSLEYVPKHQKTPALCKLAVRQDGDALKSVPETLRTADICMDAVKQYGPALQHVPEELRTESMCREAVLTAVRAAKEESKPIESNMFHHIPNELQDKVCREAGLAFDDKGYQYFVSVEPEAAPQSWRTMIQQQRSVPGKSKGKS